MAVGGIVVFDVGAALGPPEPDGEYEPGPLLPEL
jgi:hypothetical protein